MIPTKARENRRMRANKLTKNLERKYKETKCRECTVVVTRMNFAKILGKFTKVKIQYETNSPVRSKRLSNQSSPNTRLKSSENGMVEIHRNAYNAHPGRVLKSKKSNTQTSTPRPTSNVLKENNRLKKTENLNNNKIVTSKIKHYGIVFEDPKTIKHEEISSITLEDLIPHINKGILPSEDWCIDYFPKNSELKDDKIYDRIAAELEDLMYNEKTKKNSEKDDKSDEFPSIMDILNENHKSESPTKPIEAPPVTLGSNDVEAMLLDNPDNNPKPTPMEVDSTDVSSFLTGIEPLSNDDSNKTDNNKSIEDNPESPSILNEEELPKETVETAETPKAEETITVIAPIETEVSEKPVETIKTIVEDTVSSNIPVLRIGVTQVVFKKNSDGNCIKSVTCPKNLQYSISVSDKSIELLGAPKVISSLDDLQVLLQIVDECELNSIYVLH